MKTTIKNVLMGGTVIIASTIAVTSIASAADGKSKRKSRTVGIQSVLPKAPSAKIRNRVRKARNRIRNNKRKETIRIGAPGTGSRQIAQPKAPGAGNRRIAQPKAPGAGNRRIAQPKAPGANQDRSRQIQVVPNIDDRGLATVNNGNKQLFSVLPKAPSAKKPNGTKVADARPNVEPEVEREVISPRKEIVDATPQKEVVKPEPKVEEKTGQKAEKKVEEKAKPEKKKIIANGRTVKIDGEVYTYNEQTGYYESQAHYYDEDSYYESEPTYNHGYHGGSSYGGSSYGGYYSGSSYSGSSYGGYNCN